MAGEWRTDVPEGTRMELITEMYRELLRVSGETDRQKVWGSAAKFELMLWTNSTDRDTYTTKMNRKIGNLRRRAAKAQTTEAKKQPKTAPTGMPQQPQVTQQVPSNVTAVEQQGPPQQQSLQSVGGVESSQQHQQIHETQRLDTARLLQRQLREQQALVQFHHENWVSPDECFSQLRLLQQRHETERSQRQQQMSVMRAELFLNRIQQRSTATSVAPTSAASDNGSSTATATTVAPFELVPSHSGVDAASTVPLTVDPPPSKSIDAEERDCLPSEPTDTHNNRATETMDV